MADTEKWTAKIRQIGEEGAKALMVDMDVLLELVRQREASTRRLIGYRVVRKCPETGKRQWLTEYRDWTCDVSLSQTHSDDRIAEEAAVVEGGRVVPVYLRIVKRKGGE